MLGQDSEGQSVGQHSGPSFSCSTVSSLLPTSPSPKATSVCTWKSEVRVSVFRKWVLYETWSRGASPSAPEGVAHLPFII